MREKLVKAAIVGTDHHSAPMTARKLLEHFAVSQAQNQASYVPQETHAYLPEAAPVEEKRYCDARTLQQFSKLCHWVVLDSIRSVWIKKFGQAGWQLPNELIPVLDGEIGLGDAELEQLFGKRYTWYVNTAYKSKVFKLPQWRPIQDFVKLREQNPDSARQWLIENWEDLDDIQQQNYLNAMETNLCEGDIDFLTQVFQSSNLVQRPLIYKAAMFLSLLRAEVVQPLIQEILELSHIESYAQNQVLDFRWSELFSGLPIYTKDEMSKNIVGWLSKLAQLIGLVPLEDWYQHWQLSANELLEAAYHGTDTDIFFNGWHSRIIYEDHQEFALAILDFVEKRRYLEVRLKQEPLLKVLSFEQLQVYVEKQLQNYEEK